MPHQLNREIFLEIVGDLLFMRKKVQKTQWGDDLVMLRKVTIERENEKGRGGEGDVEKRKKGKSDGRRR